jgi:pimeloyl-ACP methyl ester carboxylesterase
MAEFFPSTRTTGGKGPYLNDSNLDTANDPRTSSTQSLPPAENESRHGRRKLFLLYIHGFKGTETSFQSFPAHVHNLVTILLSESHIVHTKIYPRYKTQRSLASVAEDFSNWLSPHEDELTDVILLGHSMGGLLSGELISLPPKPPATGTFRHRILGTINFDVPFLGLHPGIIASGISSLFKPAAVPVPSTPSVTSESSASLQTMDSQTSGISGRPDSVSSGGYGKPQHHNTLFVSPNDPNFNPSFANDVVLPPLRQGWRSAAHFFNKHSNNIRESIKHNVKVQAEFGLPVLNYRELAEKYKKIRALERDDESIRKAAMLNATSVPRVRFANYYTACSGRPKNTDKDSTTKQRSEPESPASVESQSASKQVDLSTPEALSSAVSSQLTLSHSNEPSTERPWAAMDEHDRSPSSGPSENSTLQSIEPIEDQDTGVTKPHEHEEPAKLVEASGLPGSSLDNHDGIQASESRTSMSSIRSGSPVRSEDGSKAIETSQKKKKKDKKFCLLPSKDAYGERDPTWVRVYMQDVDEIGAHTGLFVMNETYEKLVGDVSARIEDWVIEDASVRFALDTA